MPHDFDGFFEKALQLGVLTESSFDLLTDEIAEGRTTERAAVAAWWPQFRVALPAQPALDARFWLSKAPLVQPFRGQQSDFSVANVLAPHVPPQWEELKELGNEALEAGEFEVARTWYSRAASAASPMEAASAFFHAVEQGAPAGSVRARLAAAATDLHEVLVAHMGSSGLLTVDVAMGGEESTREIHVSEPNLPRAICYANRAACGLKLAAAAGERREARLRRRHNLEALKDARRACELCPEYQKGHFRCAQAHRALGNEAEAFKKEKAMRFYEEGTKRLPNPAMAMLTAGLIDVDTFEHVYQKAFQQHMAAEAAEYHQQPHVNPPTALVSLVPFLDAQWLIFGLEYGRAIAPRKFDALRFVQMDPHNGDALEEPPHGHASALALERTPREILGALRLLRETHGVTPASLVLGQGLTEHVELLMTSVRAEGFGQLEVVRTGRTHASLLEEVGEQSGGRGEQHDAAGRLGDQRRAEEAALLGDPAATVDSIVQAGHDAMMQAMMQSMMANATV